jgi:hypothetical protein
VVQDEATSTTVLWRPTGPEELELRRQSGWREFRWGAAVLP